jgi:plastocyanin
VGRDRLERAGGPASVKGVGLLCVLALLVLVLGCGREGEEAPDPELANARALNLPSGARLHRVTLGGRGAEEHAVPTVVPAVPGDGVEFVTVDHRVHTLVFLPDSLTAEVRSFLETTGQMESPPLVSRGSRFILRLEGAPRGRYAFLSEGHGGTAIGVVEVGPMPGADSTGTS